MFNNVVLDVVIGIVFIFMLYSLLATSIQEAIATGFALRARTLRDGVINGMLCNTPKISLWKSIILGVWGFLKEAVYTFIHRPAVSKKHKKLGHFFYDHPIIKNYGSSRVFRFPSYIAGGNFSIILLDVLRDEFSRLEDGIIAFKLAGTAGSTEDAVRGELINAADTLKLKDLFSYYASEYKKPVAERVTGLVIEEDTLRILQLHLRNSAYNMDEFKRRLLVWYDDSMDRISGWYKRQVQFILFFIGISLAVIFNVDVIQIAGKLSTDKDARKNLVDLAVKEAESYRTVVDSQRSAKQVDSVSALYRKSLDDARKKIDSGVVNANQVLALGWGDFGRKADSAAIIKAEFGEAKVADTIKKQRLDSLYEKHYVRYKAGHVLSATFTNPSKMTGFLLTALAISLGAPFWFDLLNKLINIRATGKREENNNSSGSTAGVSPGHQAVNVHVGSQTTDEEAVG
ncbi:hypothetical protein [Hufsiella ginkgonis]|uniref:Uncharacterized protein n=1 Tax=Hufsiella ginkgonis TaxID=2695274 RepID=A0A7K1XYX1_9SPHI|nr:hypothetical protein [Hufsiella ginkgonis]MXV16028.1 hypothetical protein [Hufsiella ginkgonis]